MNCPFCGSENSVTRKSIRQEFEYKGQRIIFDGYKVYECSQCSEHFELPEDNKEFEEQIIEFQRGVDRLLTPKQIKDLRKSLGFTQENFANLLDVGKKTFARYERGTVVQSKSMDKLLRLIKSDPSWALEVFNSLEHETKDCGEIKFTVYKTIKATGTYGVYGKYRSKGAIPIFAGTAHGN
jgi:HTH-type transcriptional regulator/antitoxin MqsA